MTKYKEKFEKMRIAGNLASKTLDMLINYIKPGITTEKIDQLAYNYIKDNGGYSAPQFYRGFKKSLCTSLNHVVCHGIPSERTLKPGIKLGDIGNEIQTYVEEKGYSVVRDFCGHGISNTFHETPNILHYGKKNTGLELVPGMTFTIEPMINAGKYDVKILNDGWTAVTKDKSLSAQFEHTVGITENGYEIFTESDKGYNKPPY